MNVLKLQILCRYMYPTLLFIITFNITSKDIILNVWLFNLQQKQYEVSVNMCWFSVETFLFLFLCERHNAFTTVILRTYLKEHE